MKDEEMAEQILEQMRVINMAEKMSFTIMQRIDSEVEKLVKRNKLPKFINVTPIEELALKSYLERETVNTKIDVLGTQICTVSGYLKVNRSRMSTYGDGVFYTSPLVGESEWGDY